MSTATRGIEQEECFCPIRTAKKSVKDSKHRARVRKLVIKDVLREILNSSASARRTCAVHVHVQSREGSLHSAHLGNRSRRQEHDFISICANVCEQAIDSKVAPIQPDPGEHVTKDVTPGNRAVHIANN